MCQSPADPGREWGAAPGTARGGGIWGGSGVPIPTAPPWHGAVSSTSASSQPGSSAAAGAQTFKSGSWKLFATPPSKPSPQGWNKTIFKDPSIPSHDPRMRHPHPGGSGSGWDPLTRTQGPTHLSPPQNSTSNRPLKQLFPLSQAHFLGSVLLSLIARLPRIHRGSDSRPGRAKPLANIHYPSSGELSCLVTPLSPPAQPVPGRG